MRQPLGQHPLAPLRRRHVGQIREHLPFGLAILLSLQPIIGLSKNQRIPCIKGLKALHCGENLHDFRGMLPKGVHGQQAGLLAAVCKPVDGFLNVLVEQRDVALWDELKDDLDRPALSLSEGQQQRLCVARCLALKPEVILMDEPCSELDASEAAELESLIYRLKAEYTIVIATQNLQQAARVASKTAFLYKGQLVEYDKTAVIFTRPTQQRTEDYITGRFR